MHKNLKQTIKLNVGAKIIKHLGKTGENIFDLVGKNFLDVTPQKAQTIKEKSINWD